MDNFKKQLDHMMGDTKPQEQRIKYRVHETMRPQKPKRSWQVPFITAAVAAVAVFLVMTTFPFTQNSANEGRGTPYDPLDDLAQIATLHQKNKLSLIDYEAFAALPVQTELTPLQYIDTQAFTLAGESGEYHTIIERQANLFDEAVYEVGDVVRTMTNTSSHLPIYENVYYEVVAVPGDRVVLQNGKLTVNGKSVQLDLMKNYKQNGNKIVGGYDQLLNAREYFLVNHFPAENTIEEGTITAVHKIYGEVVGLAQKGTTNSLYFELTENATPEAYFDLYLYDQLFGGGSMSAVLTKDDAIFPSSNRLGELFLEAAYRNVTYINENEVELRYQYGREGVGEYVFKLYKYPPGIWRWGK